MDLQVGFRETSAGAQKVEETVEVEGMVSRLRSNLGVQGGMGTLGFRGFRGLGV